MSKQSVREQILDIRIIPVVRAPSPELALGACRAVAQGGIPIVEVTLTIPDAPALIAELNRTMGNEILIGAGTVLDPAQARTCLDAGAKFLVSPGFNRRTVGLAREAGVLMMAGALTPTEVIRAWNAGSDFVKIFPCGNLGGPSYIRALKAALPAIPMIPTGGVNLSTVAQFLEAGVSALGIGGELISVAALERGAPEEITALARQYSALVGRRLAA